MQSNEMYPKIRATALALALVASGLLLGSCAGPDNRDDQPADIELGEQAHTAEPAVLTVPMAEFVLTQKIKQ